MIDPDTRNAMYQLHRTGMRLREISRQFRVSRNTVRTVIRLEGAMPRTVRKDKIQIDPDLLRRLYRHCDGWIQRVHEKLVEEEGIQVSYPTLTRLLRELELGKSRKARCDHVPDEPGTEMQHDTTVYRVKLAEKPTRVIASLLYLRYSKRRYLKFYRVFNRFAMKCFLHEALMFWGYAAKQCVIDNTNLARLRGSGKREDVKVLRYADRLKIYQHRICVAEYPLPADGIKNARFSPEGQPAPRHLPKHRKHGSQQEEQRLLALGPEVAAYICVSADCWPIGTSCWPRPAAGVSPTSGS